MRVLVVGGYGLIGGYIVAELATAGHQVIGAGRDISVAERMFPYAHWRRADLATFGETEWAPLLTGVDAVINCAGALQDSPRDDLQAVHLTGFLTLVRAAKAAGIHRLVHISAAGVATSPGAFALTKLAAEDALRLVDIDWVILRPGLVLGPCAYGGSALLRGLAAFPFVVPCVHQDSLIQVAAAQDVARAVLAAIRTDGPTRIAVDLVSAEAYELREILVRLRAWLGVRPAPVTALPSAIAGLTATVADALAWLGWRSPMRSTAIAQLRHGVRGDAGSAAALPAIGIRNLDELLAAAPSSVQDRWFARLYFVKPLGLAALAVFWAASGLVGLLNLGRAEAILLRSGFTPVTAAAMVTLGSSVDLFLALLVCHRRTAPSALKGMIVVSIAYLAGATLWRPDLWSDPLGSLIKVVPATVMALALLALMDDR